MRSAVLSMSIMIAGALMQGACTGDLEEHVVGPDPAMGAAVPPATVTESSPHFDSDIQKDIDAQGCTSVSCHGSAMGGFRLTKEAVGDALVANFEAFKARATSGEASLVLVKPTGESGHGGGVRFAKTDAIYARWLTWIRQGSPR